MNEKKILFLIFSIVIISEVIIFFSAFSVSGTTKWIQVKNRSGELIYEVKGDRLPSFDRYYFENNFGPLKDFNISLKEKYSPFPVRGWLFASIAFPVGFFILALFFVKAVSIIFPSFSEQMNFDFTKGHLIKVPFTKWKINIYSLVLLIFGISFVIWAVPILFDSAIARFLYLVSSYPLFFAVLLGTFVLIFGYLAYLKYRLKRFEIEKRYAIELKRLEGTDNGKDSKPLNIENKKKYLENNGGENL